MPPARQADAGPELRVLPGHLAVFPDRQPGGTVKDVDFEEFARAERSKIIRYLMNHGASPHEAEDAAQASLIEAWRKWETIVSPRAWVRQVALRDLWRSSPKAAAVRVEPVAEPPSDASFPSAADTAEITARERLICAEIAKLPPQQRQVAVMRYEGYSNQEIADLLGVDASAVRHNVLRAKSRLRHLLENRQEDAG